jgi:hypothetical protein
MSDEVVGKEVVFSKSFLKQAKRTAYEVNTVGGALITEVHAQSYFADRLLGIGYPYRAVVTGFGCDRNTYRVEVEMDGIDKNVFYVDKRSVTAKRGKRKK